MKKKFNPLRKAIISLQWVKKDRTCNLIYTFSGKSLDDYGMDFYKHGLDLARTAGSNKKLFDRFCRGYLNI